MLFSYVCIPAPLVGESVPEDERILVKDSSGDSLLNASSSTHNLPLVTGGVMAAAVTDVERASWQQEKETLYKMLDDKVDCCCCLLNHYMFMLSITKATDSEPGDLGSFFHRVPFESS